MCFMREIKIISVEPCNNWYKGVIKWLVTPCMLLCLSINNMIRCALFRPRPRLVNLCTHGEGHGLALNLLNAGIS